MENWKEELIPEEMIQHWVIDNMKPINGYLLSFVFAIVFSDTAAQQLPQLEFGTPENSEIAHVFELTVSKNQERKILFSKGRKFGIKNASLIFDGDSIRLKSIKIRGRSSLSFRRKGFSVSLNEPLEIEGLPISKFALSALVMDKNYWRNRLSFLMLNDAGIFPLLNTYVELRLNGESQGTYLMIQKPDDFTEKSGSPVLLRRDYKDKFEIDHSGNEDAKKMRKLILSGKELTRRFDNEELAAQLSGILDLDQYMRWLAFNFLVMNGDYTDEVFFYFDPESNRFNIIAWDYDDIFATQPHEGWDLRNVLLENDLLYSGEAYLDRVIDKDRYLYSRYLQILNDLTYAIDPEKIRDHFQGVFEELYPFFQDPQIISQSRHDSFGLTDTDGLREDLLKHYEFLILRLYATRKLIEEGALNSSQ